MRVDSLKIARYRQLQDITIEFQALNALIGPNGSGKSTVLRALDLAFNGEQATEIDALANRESLKAAIVANGPLAVTASITLSDDDIKIAASEAKGFEAKDWVHKKVSIHRVFDGTSDGSPTEFKVLPLTFSDKDLGERFISWLERYLKGRFLLIQAERQLDDTVQSHDVGNTRKADGRKVLPRLFKSHTTRGKITDEGFQRLKRSVQFILPEVELSPIVREQDYADLEFSGIPSSWMGSGYREVVAILAEIALSQAHIVAIEEPERGIHPGLIGPLLGALQQAVGNGQLILTTHAAHLIGALPLADTWEMRLPGIPSKVTPESVPGLAERLGLRVNDALDYPILLFVEGDSDAAAWNTWLKLSGLELSCLACDIGGFGGMKYYANADLLRKRIVKPIVCTALDGDTQKKPDAAEVLRLAEQVAKETGGIAFKLKKDTLEDYLLRPSAIAKTLKVEQGVVEREIQAYNKERERNGKPLSSKDTLKSVVFTLAGRSFSAVADSGAIAGNIASDDMDEDILNCIKEIKGLIAQKPAQPTRKDGTLPDPA